MCGMPLVTCFLHAHHTCQTTWCRVRKKPCLWMFMLACMLCTSQMMNDPNVSLPLVWHGLLGAMTSLATRLNTLLQHFTASVSTLHENTSQAVSMRQALILDLPLNGVADKAPPPSIVELEQFDSHPLSHVNHQTYRTLRWRCVTVHRNRPISALLVIMATSHFGRNNVHAVAFRSDHSSCWHRL